MSETLTGTLNRDKRRKAERDWAKDYVRAMAEEAGLVPVRYWPEHVFVEGDDKSPYGRAMLWSATGRAKAFDGIPHGARGRFTATVNRWGNSIGGDISRVRNVEVLEAAASGGESCS